jgi:multidrug efflux pump
MRFTDLFIRRPVLAVVVNLVILIAGLQSIRSLSVRQFPRSDIAVIRVSTAYIGADADLVRGFITTPLERVIASADGIDFIESSSAQGLSTITVHLELNYDTNAALTQVQAKVAQVRNDLPPEAEAPIIELETADNQFAAMYIGFASENLDRNQMTDYLTRVVQPRLTAISGVQRAEILGGRTFAMRVWLKPDKMAALGIAPAQVRDALARNNYLSALGSTKGSMVSVNLIANTDLKTAEEFRQLVVKEQDGVVVRLEEIADVVLGAEDYEADVRFDGETATFMGIWVLPTANSLEVVGEVREAIPAIGAELPVGMTVGVPYDSTIYIENAIDEVLKTLSETLLIVILVIFLFLGSVRSVLVPVVAIPISLVGAVFLMLVAGFSVNLLTLLAIVLSVGIVVDDAIVMVENVERHLHAGEPPVQAALLAARELVGPIIAMTITLAAVYTPVAIQGGLTGALFREFAFTLAGAVIVSGVVALTLSPMMGSKLLRAGDTERGFAGWINRRFERVRELYRRSLSGTLEYRPVVLTLWAIVVLLMLPFYLFSQKELAPNEDQGVVFGIVQAAANSTLDQTKLFADQVNEVYESFPENDGTFQLTFPTGGFGGMVTKPWSERERTTEQLQLEAAGALSKIPGVRVISLIPPSLPGGGDFPVDFVITSTAEPEELLAFANELVQKAFASGLFMFADADLKFDQPQAQVVFNRDMLRSQGVALSEAGRDLSTLLGGDYVNRFSIQGRSYKVIPQVKRTERLTPDQLSEIHVTGPEGRLVPLSTFATLETTTQPRELKRFQQLNAVRIQGVIPPGVSLDAALGYLEQEAAKILPAGYSVDYAGESRQLRVEGSKFLGTFLLSAILIYLVLAAQFESFRDPFIILAGSVPLALSGALLFSFLGFTTLNIYSQVGLITLVGLVAKNGILIVEFANQLQERGLDKLRAVIEASTTRLRPILMTTAATVMGHTPLILASGPGAGARNSIGIMLVTGMIIGSAFTLFVVPSIYMLVARRRQVEVEAEVRGGLLREVPAKDEPALAATGR